jgi:nucleoid-associated protein YgaU
MTRYMANLGGTTGAVLAGALMAVLLGLGAYIGLVPEGAAPVSATAPVSAVGQSAAPAVPSVPPPPTFDELRREADGTSIVAGRAAPLSEVSILLDGAQVGRTTADSSGGFAAIAMLPPKQTAQVMTLLSAKDGTVTASSDEIILAPAAAPEQPLATAQADVSPPDLSVADTKSTASEPAQVAVLKSDAQGVRLLNPAAPGITSAVALDTIGYSEMGDVRLTGRAQPETAKVRIYLDNRSVISLPVEADGRWRGDLPDVEAGIYTLRVDEVSASGTVSSRVETPFKREPGDVLAQAAAASDGPVRSVTVQTGATLWAIARERYGDGTLYLRVVEANAASIRNPDLIYPGQVFDLPN